MAGKRFTITVDEKTELIERFKKQLLPLVATVETELGIAHSEKKLERPTGPTWLAQAEKALRRVAQARECVTSDDVWAELGETANPNAYKSQMGVVFRLAKRDRIIEFNGEYVEGVRASHHRAPIRRWRSLIYRR